KKAGAQIIGGAKELYDRSDVILKVQPPVKNEELGKHEAELIREGAVYIGFISPFTNAETIKTFVSRNITGFSMEMVPRITRAQSMDALSAMATVTGYKAVLLAAGRISKMFPLLMTAAGTIPAANVLVLGAGVAGLQAIATAKRLGARVEAFDPRPAVKEQVKSVGAAFVEMEMPKDTETAGGYAKELSAEFLKKEQEAIAGRLPKMDMVISTAQVFGKKAPVLITGDMLKLMKPGSVIVDMAAGQGGNCEMTQADKMIEHGNVTIIGTTNIAALLPVDASQLYSRTLLNLFRLLYPKPDSQPDFSDEIIKGCCVTRQQMPGV
ncbi:MAG: NAD(P) transhydrogenase subunit alpha, partial [Elusimicrobia bacterium RIFOXYB2_FULL_48_7]